MKNTFLKKISGACLAILMTTVFAPVWVCGQETATEKKTETSEEFFGSRNIAGVWRTAVTPVNCQTGVPIAPMIKGLFTFNEGGTMAEYGITPGQSPALRSPGHGVWERRRGRNNYSFRFIFYRYDVNGILIGSQKVTALLEVGLGGDNITTNSAIEILDVNDNVIGSFCATSTATRFK